MEPCLNYQLSGLDMICTNNIINLIDIFIKHEVNIASLNHKSSMMLYLIFLQC